MGEVVQYVFLAFLAGVLLICMWNDRQENKRMKLEAEREKSVASAQVPNTPARTSTIGTRDLFLDTLTKIGCQYQLGEGNDTRIFFAYQGEHFLAYTTNDLRYVHLWDPCWERVDLYDIDEVSRLRKTINTSNLKTSVTAVFTIDEEEKTMDVHSKSVILFVSSIPSLEDYLTAQLLEHFRSHQMVRTEMGKLREQERNT